MTDAVLENDNVEATDAELKIWHEVEYFSNIYEILGD